MVMAQVLTKARLQSVELQSDSKVLRKTERTLLKHYTLALCPLEDALTTSTVLGEHCQPASITLCPAPL